MDGIDKEKFEEYREQLIKLLASYISRLENATSYEHFLALSDFDLVMFEDCENVRESLKNYFSNILWEINDGEIFNEAEELSKN